MGKRPHKNTAVKGQTKLPTAQRLTEAPSLGEEATPHTGPVPPPSVSEESLPAAFRRTTPKLAVRIGATVQGAPPSRQPLNGAAVRPSQPGPPGW